MVKWLAVLLVALAIAAMGVFSCGGGDLPVGEIRGSARAPQLDEARASAQAEAASLLAARDAPPMPRPKQILFGDLHVHTQYSIDAFLYALPIFATGDGAHPPADACDYARHCSALDFFSINDHAEGITPERWQATIDSLRECEARAGDVEDPDIVPFLGWEWTQVGTTPERHYGHKNVVLRGLGAADITARPIAYRPAEDDGRKPNPLLLRTGEALASLAGAPYADFLWWLGRLLAMPDCDPNVASPDLPGDCMESAGTPAELFRKLDEWGVDSLVIPHGLAWGIHSPPGASIANQLAPGQHDPERQKLIEVFSGHGNSEEYRAELERPQAGSASEVCPAPTPGFLPCCWQAGVLMRARCGDLPEAECEAKVEEARRAALAASVQPTAVIPDASIEEWLDCDQCRDCFKPAHSLRPRESAQYALAVGRFDDDDETPDRFRFGFIASSDNHSARAGTGFKQVRRLESTDTRGLVDTPIVRRLGGVDERALPASELPRAFTPNPRSFDALFDTERTSSFLYPGGLVAVHAEARDRDAIWSGLARREVYGTSGPRILLWFDWLSPSGQRAPMGSEVEAREAPRFEVRAVGAHVQEPGCPDVAGAGLSRDELEALCYGECDHPGDTRIAIERIEIVRIRPQQASGERIADRIEDPWRVFECAPDPTGCRVEFVDDAFTQQAGEVVYYARALQASTPAINGAGARVAFDDEGRALSARPCLAGIGGDPDDDCLAPVHERAWSSPIFVAPAVPAASGDRAPAVVAE